MALSGPPCPRQGEGPVADSPWYEDYFSPATPLQPDESGGHRFSYQESSGQQTLVVPIDGERQIFLCLQRL
jgi:hypothetical protein